MVVHHWSDDGMVMYHRRSLLYIQDQIFSTWSFIRLLTSSRSFPSDLYDFPPIQVAALISLTAAKLYFPFFCPHWQLVLPLNLSFLPPMLRLLLPFVHFLHNRYYFGHSVMFEWCKGRFTKSESQNWSVEGSTPERLITITPDSFGGW